MPFFQSPSDFTISGSVFNTASGSITINISRPNQRPITTITTGDRQPLSDSQLESDVNQPIPDSQNLSRIIGKVENTGSPVDTTGDETTQPPKTDGQHPVVDDQALKTDAQQQTKATSPTADEAEGWERYVHPEGWIYYFKQHDDESEGIACHEIRGTLTDEIVPSAIHVAGNAIVTPTITANTIRNLIPQNSTIAKVAIPWSGGLYVRAYVDDRRWYASNDKELLFRQQHTNEEANKLQRNYWKFMHDYPAHHSLPPGAVIAARQALTCHVMEGLVRKSGTRAPFTLAESKAPLESFDVIEKIDDEKDLKQLVPATAQLPLPFPLKTILVAWVLLNVAKHRQTSKYGLYTFEDARKAESLGEPSVMFILVSSICLFAPLDHRAHIYAAKRSSELRGDIETWPAYIDTLVREWSTFNLAATVLLSASVGFLAVPGIDSVTRIIVLLSVVFTLGSIITGVYLLWRHQGGGGRLEYSMSLLHPGHNVDLLAIILSTPFTFLVWGVLTFLVAAISYSFLGFQPTIQGTNVPIRGRAFISVFVLSIVVLMVMLISFVFFRSFRKRRGRAMSV